MGIDAFRREKYLKTTYGNRIISKLAAGIISQAKEKISIDAGAHLFPIYL